MEDKCRLFFCVLTELKLYVMSGKVSYVTKEGLKKLQDELERLQNVERPNQRLSYRGMNGEFARFKIGFRLRYQSIGHGCTVFRITDSHLVQHLHFGRIQLGFVNHPASSYGILQLSNLCFKQSLRIFCRIIWRRKPILKRANSPFIPR